MRRQSYCFRAPRIALYRCAKIEINVSSQPVCTRPVEDYFKWLTLNTRQNLSTPGFVPRPSCVCKFSATVLPGKGKLNIRSQTDLVGRLRPTCNSLVHSVPRLLHVYAL